jgi:hypothetical protein
MKLEIYQLIVFVYAPLVLSFVGLCQTLAHGIVFIHLTAKYTIYFHNKFLYPGFAFFYYRYMAALATALKRQQNLD